MHSGCCTTWYQHPFYTNQVEVAKAQGANVAELRLDYLEEFDPETDLQMLISESALPVIITVRPTWEGCALATQYVTTRDTHVHSIRDTHTHTLNTWHTHTLDT